MPAIAAAAITGGSKAGATIYGATKQAGSARTAGDIQARSAAEALAFEREQARIEKEQYDQEYARKVALEDEDRTRFFRLQDAREGRLDPIRARSARTLTSLMQPGGFPAIPVGRASGAAPLSTLMKG